ncbi:putative zinc-binding metallopeptidase [Weeksellaceae bacterium TAE3-ERU29]|nr:putative zinc-binding metallopeptidase [Weeksellaceae bacterium TAE3-ERU29]
MKKYIIPSFAFFVSLLFIQCSDDDSLREESVIQMQEKPNTELQTWIDETYQKPYNIEIAYQWSSESTFKNTLLYPPEEEKVKMYLKALKSVWIDLYNEMGGEDFIKNLSPTEIKLFGDANIDGFGVERLQVTEKSPFPFTLFRVNEFQNNKQSVERLVRNVQNNTAKLMALRKPFDKEAFAKLNMRPYRLNDIGSGRDIYKISTSFYQGFYSFPAGRFSVDEDFAETLSVLLTYPKHEVDQMIEYASTPSDSYYKEVERARQAKVTLEAKRDFVAKYLKDKYDIDLYLLNIKSLVYIQNYLKNNQ